MPTGAISFNNIPADLRVPGVYTEIDNSKAGIFSELNRSLIIGQAIGATSEVPVLVPSVDWVKATYGAGSQLAVMVENFRNNNQFSELWVLPLADAGSSTAATCTVTVTGTATTSGTLSVYAGGEKVLVPVTKGDTATVVAANIVTYISTEYDLPVSAVAAAGVVTVTAKNKGTLGNSIKVLVNYYGTQEGEYVPSGLTVVATAMSGGATNPVLSTKLPLIGNLEVSFFFHPYVDTTSLDAFRDFLQSRWDPLAGDLNGQAFTATSNTVSALQTLGVDRNDENHTILGYETSHPVWSLHWIGSLGGVVASQLVNDPARQLGTLPLRGISGIREVDRFSLSNRQTLLNSGISTIEYTRRGQVRLERVITTYQRNDNGQLDASYLDVMTRTTLSVFKKSVAQWMTQRFGRVKLASNNAQFGGGRAIATPANIKASLVSWYMTMERAGLAQNTPGFERNMRVTLNPNDPNRVDILLAPFLVNNLMVAAVKIEFRLQS